MKSGLEVEFFFLRGLLCVIGLKNRGVLAEKIGIAGRACASPVAGSITGMEDPMPNSETRLFSLSRSMRGCLLFAVAAGLLASFGCANGEIRLGDPFDRELKLEEAQHRYTVLVRWSDFQRAKNFVAKADRDAFVKRMKALDEARFTDYESDTIELDDEKQTATIHVVYTLYLPTSPYEVEIGETQVWTRDGLSNAWRVDSTFDALHGVAAN
jgi:hypothetical protein